MQEATFLPAVNWHRSKIFETVGSDKLCYASKQDLVVVSWNDDGCSSKIIKCAHDRMVNYVCAVPKTGEETFGKSVVTCGEDSFVRLWNLETLTSQKAHDSHMSREEKEIAGVVWLPADPNIVVSVSPNGVFVIWHLAQNVTNKYAMRLSRITSITCCPNDATLVAVGNATGKVTIVRLGQKVQTVHNLRACEAGITDLAWQNSDLDSIIAATSVQGELSLWNSTSGKLVKNLKLLPRGERASDNIQIFPLLWYNSNTLLVRKGKSLCALDATCLSMAEDSWRNDNNIVKTVHQRHRREFHSIAHDSGSNIVWTIGGDRSIIVYDVENEKVISSIGIMFGGAICSAVSPHDPNKVAFGSADGCVRFWDVTQPTGSAFVYSKNIKDRVMSLAWHPEKENVFVYGTSAGRIGLMDPNSGSPSLLPPASNRDIYWLCWGPKFSGGGKELALYAITNGKLLMYADVNSQHGAENLTNDLQLQSKVSDLAWKPDFSVLTVGCVDGSIHFYKPPCSTPCHVLSVNSTLIQNLTWHPQMTSLDTELSSYHDLLTNGSRDTSGDIFIYKITQNNESVSSSIFSTLSGHSGYVQAVSWSPHVPGMLVSTSVDYTIIVWNVLTQTPLVTYCRTPPTISAFAFFSPLDSDFVISGSFDATIELWKISSKVGLDIPTIELQSARTNGKKEKKKHQATNFRDCEMAKVSFDGSQSFKNGDGLTASSNFLLAKKKNHVSVQKHSTLKSLWSCNPSISTYSILKAAEKETTPNYSMTLFNSDPALDDALTKLRGNWRPSESQDNYSDLLIWQGDLKEHLKKCIDSGCLTPYLVSLAPSISPRFWLEACQALARQFRAELKFKEAANYYLISQQTEEAIKCLLDGNLYLEALFVGRNNLPDSDLFKSTVRKYAEILHRQGLFIKAAECYIYLKDYQEAAKSLSQEKGPESLVTAALAAKMAGNVDLQKSLILEAYQCLMLREDNELRMSLCADHSEFKLLQFLEKIKSYVENLCLDSPAISVLSDGLEAEDAKEIYSQIMRMGKCNTTQEGNINVLVWRTCQQLGLSLTSNSPQRLRHIIKALDCLRQLGPNVCYFFCKALAPNLPDLGIFGFEGELGISLRSFLCNALIEQITVTEMEKTQFLHHIHKLYKDLLNEKSISYHRAKVRLSNIERDLFNKLANGKKNCDESEISQIKYLEKLKIEDTDADVCTISDCNDKITNSGDKGSELLKALIAEQRSLTSDIETLEANREVVLNPLPGLLKLRVFCESVKEVDSISSEILSDIIDNYLPLFL